MTQTHTPECIAKEWFEEQMKYMPWLVFIFDKGQLISYAGKHRTIQNSEASQWGDLVGYLGKGRQKRKFGNFDALLVPITHEIKERMFINSARHLLGA